MKSGEMTERVNRQDSHGFFKNWAIAAPFLKENDKWIDDFVEEENWNFVKVPVAEPLTPWHSRGAKTPIRDWLTHLKQSYAAVKTQSDGIITVFPQLALTTSMLLMLFGKRKTRLVAWTFNLGSLGSNLKGRISGFILCKVSVFIVHSHEEIFSYSKWLGLPQDRFRFIPLQKGDMADYGKSDKPPYVLSMGAANRDYGTLAEAVKSLELPVIVVAKQEQLSQFENLSNVTAMHGLTEEECYELLAHARINVIPLADTRTAAGQVSFINGMRLGIATIATRCVGSVDYIEDGNTGLLVAPGDAESLRDAILKLWEEDDLRECIANQAKHHARKHFSDQAAARNLLSVIRGVGCGGI